LAFPLRLDAFPLRQEAGCHRLEAQTPDRIAFPLRLEAMALRQLAVRHRLEAERKYLTTTRKEETTEPKYPSHELASSKSSTSFIEGRCLP
jgi:hypothetical protein